MSFKGTLFFKKFMYNIEYLLRHVFLDHVN